MEASIKAGTSVPDDVEQREQSVFAKYPSIEASSIILNYVKNTILVEDRKYKISFYPYRKIDVNASYDWYCEQCDYKNFARRNRCYRCETEKTQNCRLNYSSQPTTIKVHKEDNINNCSLMIRGSVITEV